MSTTESGNNIMLVANWESGVGYAWWLMENFWVCIDEHFSSKGATSYLAYPSITTLPEAIESSSIVTLELDFQNRSLHNLLRMRRTLKQHDIRYMYFSDVAGFGWFNLWLRFCGVSKIVVHDHTPGTRTRPSALKALYKSARNLLPWYNCDHLIATTEFVKQRIHNTSRTPLTRISVAPNGIVPIDLATADRAYCRQQFGIADDRKLIITTGRANAYKGIDFFIRCAHHLVHERGHKDLHFLFCGDGPDLQAFRKLSSELDIDDCFTFAGNRQDVRQLLPGCDIAMHCAQGEVGYSLSILEYMSAGLPTLVPDRESTRQATTHDVTGLLYQPGDIEAASDAIERCLDDDTARRLGERAAASVRDEFNLTRTNEHLVAALDKVFR